MSTIRDVSKEAGLSIATVSRALSSPEKVTAQSLKKVHAAIDKLQYRPNMLSQQFRNKQSNAIVILVPDLTNLFFAKVISGIEKITQEQGYSVLLGYTHDSLKIEKQYINLVETKQADGIIQLRPYQENDSALPITRVPAVNASGCDNTPYPTVRIDNINAVKEVVKYLISLGHKRIGVITGLQNNRHSIDRLKGYKLALQEANICYDESLVTEGDFTLKSGLLASEHFSRHPLMPTAIVCMNDEMAIGAMKGFKAKGLHIPEDISITGFDDLDVSKYCDPPLTTVTQPAKMIGQRAAELLFQIINQEETTLADQVLPVEFVIRQSTAPPKI